MAVEWREQVLLNSERLQSLRFVSISRITAMKPTGEKTYKRRHLILKVYTTAEKSEVTSLKDPLQSKMCFSYSFFT